MSPLVSSGMPYHRRITLRPDTPEAGTLEAHMQDHCHHMRVRISHSEGQILNATGEGLRLPWNTCPLGVAGIGRLTGMTVSAALDARNWPGGRTANCVHSADLALVALAHVDDTETTVYAITVTPATAQVRQARLDRNGELLLQWTIEGSTLTSPPELAGRSLDRADFQSWTAKLDPAAKEAATILRRACHIAPSRDIDLDIYQVASESIGADASCYTLQDGVIDTARRVVGSSRIELTDADRVSSR